MSVGKITRQIRSGISRGKRKHERLRSHLLGEIASGVLNPGDALLAERQLAEMMQLSRTTVRQTLDDLEREGVIRRVQGKGTFIAEKKEGNVVSRTASFAVIALDVARGFYPSLLAGFENAANEAGRPVVVCNSENQLDRQASHILRLLDQRVAGVVLNPCSQVVTPSYHVRLLQDAGIPVVLLHRAVPDVSAPVLELPSEEMGRRAGKLLLESGHRRIAFVAAHRSKLMEQFEAGLRQALDEAGCALPATLVDYGHFGTASSHDYSQAELYCEEVLRRMSSMPEPPTALFLPYDAVAEIAFLVSSRLGLRVPQDLSIVSVGPHQREGAILQKLTAFTIDEAAVAQRSISLLLEMRDGRRPIQDNMHFRLPLEFADGQTLASRNRK